MSIHTYTYSPSIDTADVWHCVHTHTYACIRVLALRAYAYIRIHTHTERYLKERACENAVGNHPLCPYNALLLAACVRESVSVSVSVSVRVSVSVSASASVSVSVSVRV
jgi:hypothetical protein